MAIDIHKRGDFHNVFWIAWPQALGFLVITIQNMVDMFWIGRLGTSEVAAVSVCGNVITVIFAFSWFLHVGTVALISRAIGAREGGHATNTLANSFILGVATGLAILVAGWAAAPAIMNFFNVDPVVADLGVTFFRSILGHITLLMFTIPAMAAYSSAGDTLTPLVLNSIGVLLNIALDPIFIFEPGVEVAIGGFTMRPGVFGWGLMGAGLATVAATALIFLVYMLTAFSKRFPVDVPKRGNISIDPARIAQIIKIGVPGAVAQMSRPLSTVILLRLIARFGTGPVAGFGISMRWYHVNWILIGGMSAAASVLVGQHLGAESPKSASRVSRKLIFTGVVIQFLSTAIYFIFAERLVAIMDPNPETVKAGAAFMKWVVLGFLLSSPGGLAAAAMNGAGDTMPGMVAGLASNWLVKLPLAWLLAQSPTLGLDGVWLGMFFSLVVEGAMCLTWYSKGNWKNKVLLEKETPANKFAA